MEQLKCDVCGGKLIMKSGAVAACDSCGMEYSKERVQEKVQEITGTVQVRGLNTVEQDIANVDALMNVGRLKDAKKILDNLVVKAPTDINLWSQYAQFAYKAMEQSYMYMYDFDVDRYGSLSSSIERYKCFEEKIQEYWANAQRISGNTLDPEINQQFIDLFQNITALIEEETSAAKDATQRLIERFYTEPQSYQIILRYPSGNKGNYSGDGYLIWNEDSGKYCAQYHSDYYGDDSLYPGKERTAGSVKSHYDSWPQAYQESISEIKKFYKDCCNNASLCEKYIIGESKPSSVRQTKLVSYLCGDTIAKQLNQKYPYDSWVGIGWGICGVNGNTLSVGNFHRSDGILRFSGVYETYPMIHTVRGNMQEIIEEVKKTPKGCYIATAVYESYDCPEVWMLRRFRDDVLATSRYGRFFIKAYYAISPTLVKWFGSTKWFNRFWKGRLDKLISYLHFQGVSDLPYQD